jgi:signal transduction histidine kinase
MIKQAAGPGTVVSYELDSNIPPCIVDRAQFDAAIINLVVNAAQSMTSGAILIATLPVSVRDRQDHGLKPGHYVAVRVTDSGCGIAPADLRRVFEPFYTTKNTGTGRGLAQVYAFMHNIDGDARIASQINAGTTVELLFPCQEARLEAGTAPNRFVRRDPSDTIESAQPQMTGQ